MRLFLLRFLPFLLFSPPLILPATAQKYRTAGGVRLGGGNYGFTLQQRVLEKTTLEGLAILGAREVTGTVLAEQHFPILGRALNYYIGAGAHLGTHKDRGTVGGFDGIVGAEWKLPIAPLLVSFDLKPTYEINNDDWFRFPTAVSVRYVLIKEKKKPFLGGVFSGDDDERPRKKKSRNKSSGSKPRLLDGLFGN